MFSKHDNDINELNNHRRLTKAFVQMFILSPVEIRCEVDQNCVNFCSLTGFAIIFNLLSRASRMKSQGQVQPSR